MKLQSLILFTIPFFFVNFAFGYNYKLHNYLGGMTENYLEQYDKNMYTNVKSIILEPLGVASTWADRVKNTKEYSWTRQLHFIDIPSTECNRLSGKNYNNWCKNDCIISAIMNFTNLLSTNNKSCIPKRDLFKFLIHFIQDFNQPMHVFGDARGGNDDHIILHIDGHNKSTNLHFLWDSFVPEYYLKNYEYSVSEIIPHVTTEQELLDLMLNVLDDTFLLACTVVPAGNYVVFEDYFNESAVKKLFDNYNLLIINVINYIFI